VGRGSSQADNVIHKDRPRKTFEAQLPHRFRFNQYFDCALDAWRDQDLLAIRLVTKTRGKIRHRVWQRNRSTFQNRFCLVWRMPRKCPRQSPTDLRRVTDLLPQPMVSLVMITLAQRPPKVSANPLKSKVAEIERRVPQQPNPGDRPFLHPPSILFRSARS
jgi:hypothetical protein